MCFWFFKSKEEREAERMKKEGKRLLRQKQKEQEKARKLKEKEEQKAKKRGAIVEENEPEEAICETTAQEKAEQEHIEEATEEVAVTEEEVKEKKPRPANYHISLREDGRWQVKRAKGERAIKIFKTQAEAIEFAKMRAESMDGSITIHKKDGKIRKQKY